MLFSNFCHYNANNQDRNHHTQRVRIVAIIPILCDSMSLKHQYIKIWPSNIRVYYLPNWLSEQFGTNVLRSWNQFHRIPYTWIAREGNISRHLYAAVPTCPTFVVVLSALLCHGEWCYKQDISITFGLESAVCNSKTFLSFLCFSKSRTH